MNVPAVPTRSDQLPPRLTLSRGVGLGSLLLVVLLTWAALTDVDVVVSAPAEARPAAGVFELRAAAAGVIRHVSVLEGDLVASGDVLIELADRSVQSDVRAKAMALEDRRRALLEDRALLASLEDQPAQHWPGAARDRLDVHRNSLARLRREEDALAAELDLARRRLAAARHQLAIAQARDGAVDRAHARGAVSRFELLRSRESLALRNADVSTAEGSIRVIQDRLAAHRLGTIEHAGTFRLELIDSVTTGRAEVARLEAELADAVRQRRLGRIVAPASGTVERLTAGVGDYVERGEVLGAVVPASSELFFEARIAPAQIAFLSPGQRCRLKLDALPFVRYGALPCVLRRIGRDAVAEGNGHAHYLARIQVASARVRADGQDVDLRAGATAWVDIVAGQRSVLGFFTEPLQRFAREALRER